MPLAFHKKILDEVFENDCLHVIARGLGLHKLILQLLRAFCDPGQLVFLLNVDEDEEAYFVNQLKKDGSPHSPKFMRSDFSIKERIDCYHKGGCLVVNPRNLVVDLLHKRIPTHLISGFLVNKAHKVDDDSVEAFVFRLYRESNTTGFIKAFTQNPEFLTHDRALEKVMKALQVKAVHLWPRFKLEAIQSLEGNVPDVVELYPPMSDRVAGIQHYITELMSMVLMELRAKSKHMQKISNDEVTVENVLSGWFFKHLRNELGPAWGSLPSSTKRYLDDLASLKDLLSLLYSLDSVAFYQFVDNLIWTSRSYSGVPGVEIPAEWVLMPMTSKLLALAKERVYRISKRKEDASVDGQRIGAERPESSEPRLSLELEADPKWKVLKEIFDEIQAGHSHKNGQPRILVMVASESIKLQLAELLCRGPREMLLRKFRRYLLEKYPYSTKIPNQSEESSILQREADSIRTSFPLSAIYGSVALASRPILKRERTAELILDKNAPKRKRQKRQTDKLSAAADAAAAAGGNAVRNQAVKRPAPQKSRGKPSSSVPEINVAELQKNSEEDALNAQRFKEMQEKNLQAEFDACFEAISDPWLWIYTYSDTQTILETLRPQYIVMYDADLAFIRRVEVYTNEFPTSRIRVYFMVRGESAEQQQYLTAIHREKVAFQKLVKLKSQLMLHVDPKLLTEVDRDVQLQELHALELEQRDTSRKGGATLRRLQPQIGSHGQVVVDMREFRSALPSQLHSKGITIIPLTLEVGDYVLTSNLCLERKSVQDLIQSFQSGRLFNQIEAMCRYYSQPTLLIEFSRHHPFSLIGHPNYSGLSGGIGITDRLALLVIHFPSMRLLWSRSPQVTAGLVEVLKKGKIEPNPDTVAQVGLDGAGQESSNTESDSLVAEDVLSKLPGVTSSNIVAMMKEFDDLRSVFSAPFSKLVEVMGNKAHASLLFSFVHRTTWDAEG